MKRKNPFFDEGQDEATEKLARKLKQSTKKTQDEDVHLLSSGNTLLNLACAGKVFGCFREGGFYLVVGDSSSGKTALRRSSR